MSKIKKIVVVLCSIILVGNFSDFVCFASTSTPELNSEVEGFNDTQFEKLVEIVVYLNENIGNEQKVFDALQDISSNNDDKNRSIFGDIGSIWNALTDSEKKLLIRYPFEALKVNTAKNIATTQTEIKFGRNGLGDRSDAFRHGIWNAEMTILIGGEKAELFATAHEDKDTTGVESDGYSKTEHKNMDLHNNEVGRILGSENPSASEDEMADIIYNNIYQEDTRFIWLHE